jgi:hypothetical protein
MRLRDYDTQKENLQQLQLDLRREITELDLESSDEKTLYKMKDLFKRCRNVEGSQAQLGLIEVEIVYTPECYDCKHYDYYDKFCNKRDRKAYEQGICEEFEKRPKRKD